MQRKHDKYNLHKKVEKSAGIYKSNTIKRLKDENDRIIVGKEEKMNTWRNYIQYRYDNTSGPERIPEFVQWTTYT